MNFTNSCPKDKGVQGRTDECVDGNPPACITALISKSFPYRNTEVKGFESCPIAAEAPAAIRT